MSAIRDASLNHSCERRVVADSLDVGLTSVNYR
jgi:hypothetical protein